MLHRHHPPNQHLWTGVGGKLHPGEAPLAACLREVREETGYVISSARFAGLLTWEGFEVSDGGLYLFVAPAPEGDPTPCAEGDLRWQTRAWVCSAPEVVSNIHYFASAILDGAPPQVYHFVYQHGQIIHHEPRPLPPTVAL